MHTPISPRATWAARLPFYYGWINVVVASVAMTATLPGRTHGLGLITEPLLGDLALDRAHFSQLNLVSSLLGSLFCLPVGWLIDRIGVRSVLLGVTLALALSVRGMVDVTTPTQLFWWLLLVRGFGQSALSVVSMAIIGKWFRRRAGAAMGAFAVLLAFGFIASVLHVGEAVKLAGWRTAWREIAVSLFAFAPVGWLFTRSTPESCGLSIDGDAMAAVLEANAPPAGPEFTLRQALATPLFWVFALGTSAFNFAWSAVTLFNESILAGRGFDHDDSVMVMTVLTGTGLLANLVAGAATKKERLGSVLGVGLLLLVGAAAVAPVMSSKALLQTYAAVMGLAGGVITVVFFAVWGQVFGRSQLGRIQGAAQLLTVLASALGPVVAAECEARTGSYTLFFHGLALVTGMLALAAFIVPVPAAAPGR